MYLFFYMGLVYGFAPPQNHYVPHHINNSTLIVISAQLAKMGGGVDIIWIKRNYEIFGVGNGGDITVISKLELQNGPLIKYIWDDLGLRFR
jgi:hypothetical protein